jgi:hypothetical protein
MIQIVFPTPAKDITILIASILMSTEREKPQAEKLTHLRHDAPQENERLN